MDFPVVLPSLFGVLPWRTPQLLGIKFPQLHGLRRHLLLRGDLLAGPRGSSWGQIEIACGSPYLTIHLKIS